MEGLKQRGIVEVRKSVKKHAPAILYISTDPHHFVGEGGYVGWKEISE